MFSRYRQVLSLPGALGFSAAGVLARAPMSIEGISLILMVRAVYDSYTLAGFISAASVITYALCAPLLSRLVDRYGQAKVMVPSIIISSLAVAGIIAGAIAVVDPWVITVLAIIAGATGGSMGALVRARWAYVTKNAAQLQAAYAMEAAFDELVFVLGPVIATIVTSTIHPTAGLWVALFFMIFGSLAFLIQTKTEPPTSPKIKGQKQESVMRNPAMIVLALTYVGTGALFGAQDLSVVADADAAGMSSLAGVILASMSLGSLISAVVYGSRLWKTPLSKLFMVGVLALAIGVSPFFLSPNLLVLAILMFIAGIAIAPTMTNVNTVVQRLMPASRLTEGLTWMSTAMTLGVSLGSAVAGPVIDSSGHRGGFLVVLGFAWVMVLVAALGYRTLQRHIETKGSVVEQVTGDAQWDSAAKDAPPGEQGFESAAPEPTVQPPSRPSE